MTKKLKKALRRQKRKTKQEVLQIAGTLGIALDGQRIVEVPNRNSFVYVKLRDNQNEVVQAFNNKVASAYGLPVLVERQGNYYVVIGTNSQRYQNNQTSFAPYLPRHGNTHSFDIESGGGGDIVWVHSKQMMPLLVLPSGTLGAPNVIMSSYVLKKDNGTWMYVGNTGTQVFSNYRPSSPTGAVMGLVYLDTDSGNPKILINSGTVFLNSITGTSQIVQYIPSVPSPSTQIPLAAVRLITGTNAITWNNIYDVRQWLHAVPTGSGGGSGNITAQDEGVSLGTASTFNFTGDAVTATISGSVVNVQVVASGSFTQAQGDSRYLKLNTDNDPITGELRVSGSFDFGYTKPNREANAGKAGYELFSSGYMEWVGAGTGTPRWHRFYDRVRTDHVQAITLQATSLPESWIYLNGTGTTTGPTAAQLHTNVTGTDSVLGVRGTDNASVLMSVTDVAEAVFYATAIGTFLGGVQVPSGTTWFGAPWKPTVDINQNSIPWPDNGVLSTMALRTSTTQPASGNLVATLQVNGVDTALTVTLTNAAGSPVTTTDSTHVVVINAGDTLRWKFVNGAFSSSATLQAMTMKLNKNATA